MSENAELTHVLDCYQRGLAYGYGRLAFDINRNGHKRPYIGLSQAGRCRRQTYYAVHPDVPAPELTTGQRAIYTDGYLFEADTLTRLDTGGAVLVNPGTRVSHPQYPGDIYGHIDAQILGTDNKFRTLEIKSMRGFPQAKTLGAKGRGDKKTFDNVVREHPAGWILRAGATKDVQPEYYAQVQAYLWASPEYDARKFGAIIVYRMKEDGRIAVESIEYDDELARGAVKRLENVREALRSNDLPGRDHSPASDWQCGYCDFAEMCKATPA